MSRAAFPGHREADVQLRDGSTVHIRPVRAGDEPALRDFLEGLSVEARAFRFFSAGANLAAAARWAADVDYGDSYGLVALAGGERRVVGHATFYRTGPGRAEVAFAVADAYQGRGLGTLLLAHLAEAAEEAGIGTLEAEVLAENHRMVGLFRESGFPVRTRAGAGVIHAEMPAALTPAAVERFERRDAVAADAALGVLLRPRSLAVIGASRRRGTIGGELLHNLIAGGFAGEVHPVNRSAGHVQGRPAFPSVLAVPGDVDLAVIAVPAAEVVEVARQCADKGARSLVVVSAGFAEAGVEGAERQRELLEVCRAAGMRLVGPNCMGVLNTHPAVRLNATFAPAPPPPGRVGFLSQSGALGLALIARAAALGLGLSSFVSVGNKADISGNDLLQHWEADPGTDLILLYLESFGNPRRFARIARRVARSKPIIAVKSGRSAPGERASSSHTGALVAGSDATVDALFAQAGVIRTDTLGELFDVASLLASQPPPAGPRVAVVTNAGGPGILCADACEAAGLEVVELSPDLRRRLDAFLPAEASSANPVDMLAAAGGEDYRRVVEQISRSGEVDAVVTIFIPPLPGRAGEVEAALCRARSALPEGLPLLAVMMSGERPPSEPGSRLPTFGFPEEAARALAHAARYGAWRARPQEPVAEFPDARADEAAAAIAAALARDAGAERWLPPEAVERMLDCWGVPLVESRLAYTAEEAGWAASELGGAVALKAVGPGLVHKTEIGGVRLGLEGAPETERAAAEMAACVAGAGHSIDGFQVQRMAPAGVELLVGVVHDRHFGPVLACGAGGTSAELLGDLALRLPPISRRDGAAMLRSLRSFPLLQGYRGAPGADMEALEELLLRVGALAETHPEVAEIDLNPVVATPTGSVVVDARVRVEPAAPRRPWPALRR